MKNKIKLIQAVLPFDNYTIDDSNQNFSFKTYNYQIPIGNYTITSLLTQIKSQVTPIASSFNIAVNTLRGIIVMSDSAAFDFKMDSELASMLGYKKSFYSGSSVYSGE